MALKPNRKGNSKEELRFTRRGLMSVLLTLPLLAALFGFVSQQRGAPVFPAPPADTPVRGKILASDGTILAYGPANDRRYPQGTLAANLLGFTGALQPDGRYGLEGLEYSLDRRLQAGHNVTLTIDPTLQAAAETNLKRVAEKNQAADGMAVILQVGTGRILAAASYPSFDPNHWQQASANDMMDRPFAQEYEPGSVMKPFVIAGLIQDGLLKPTEMIPAPMSVHVGDKTFHDVEWHKPVLSIPDILRYSSNVGMIHLTWRFTPKQLHGWLARYGFGQPLDLTSIYSTSGILNPWQNWVPQDQASNTIGQNVSTTAVQLAAAYSILANGGVYVPPRLVEGSSLPPPHRVLEKHVADTVFKMLIHVVNASDLRYSKIPGVSVAGKTGTADIYNRRLGTYPKGEYSITFAGVFPADHPRVVTIVTLQKPQVGSKTSTWVAAPLFRAIGSEVVAHWGLAPGSVALADSRH
jgi:cell division protein FtsI (penicillin-binding protein 3)